MACRVELKDLPSNASAQERKVAFNRLHTNFKNRVAQAGIMHEYKKHQYYETPGEKKRRKAKESRNQRLKESLRESFSEKKPKKERERHDER